MANPPSFPNRTLILYLISLSFVVFGCGRKNKEGELKSARPQAEQTRLQAEMDRLLEVPHEHDPARRPLFLSERITNRRDWLLAVLKQGYAATAHTNIQWDSSAQRAVQAYADYTRVANSQDNFSELTNGILSAIARGCDDPMVQYMQVRYGLFESNRTEEAFALASMAAFRSMLTSQYHPLLKFMAGVRAVDAARAAEIKGNRRVPIEYATGCLEDLARDTNAPASEIFETAFMWAEHSSHSGWVSAIMSHLEEILENNWGREEAFFRLRGLTEIDRAWDARGGDYANKVTDQAWEQFRTHLNQAALSLETAWQRNPSNAYTAYLMMKVELGQGQGRARMEKWFQRAMGLATNDYDAALLMSYYLEPRWYGSGDIALQFARSCVSSTNWAGHVPLVLADLHHSLAAYYKLKESPEYWQKPGVWDDVHSSYEKFFELNPSEYGYRHDYGRDAYLCGQYEVFLAQAKLFPWTNYTFFGGEAQFRQMLKRSLSATKEG